MGDHLNKIINGDCLEIMKQIPTESVDLVCTDPPYGIGFMGKEWDTFKPDKLAQGVVRSSRKNETLKVAESRDTGSAAMEAARYDHSPTGAVKFREWFTNISFEMLRVLKPGGFAFVCIGSRQDSVSAAITAMTEAGFKTDFTSLFWAYASGFPKAMNIGKMVDKRNRVKGQVIGKGRAGAGMNKGKGFGVNTTNGGEATSKWDIRNVVSDLVGSYGGFQPKPAVEVIIVAMKGLSEKTYVDQALKNGKGVTWLDDARIPYKENDIPKGGFGGMEIGIGKPTETQDYLGSEDPNANGRFPANILVSDEVLGSHSRFFSLDEWAKTLPFLVVSKAAKSEKNKGLEGFEEKSVQGGGGIYNEEVGRKFGSIKVAKANHHPTVKPLKLMSYLIALGSRPGDSILDPFAGSGTTCLAAKQLNRNYIGIEREVEYIEIAEARLKQPVEQVLAI
jgi:DNA modification methylase